MKVTDLTPTASDAAAVTVTFRETRSPVVGDVMVIDGAVTSADDWAATGACDQVVNMRAVTASVRMGAVISSCCGNDAAMFKIGSKGCVRVPGLSGWIARMPTRGRNAPPCDTQSCAVMCQICHADLHIRNHDPRENRERVRPSGVASGRRCR